MSRALKSDFILHPPMGSEVPGKVDANIYMSWNPRDLKESINTEKDPEQKAKMLSALKQLTYPGRRSLLASELRHLSFLLLKSEVVNPAVNLPYYQDSEVDQGQDEIIDSLRGLSDNDNALRDDYARQGIRPLKDAPYTEGDFLTPSESPFGLLVVKPRGDGPDPEGMEYPDPPTGGDIDCF